VDLDAEHRTLVRGFSVSFAGTSRSLPRSLIHDEFMEAKMGRGILLWLLGVPIPVIILLWLFLGR
jgi:hypothetical protein